MAGAKQPSKVGTVLFVAENGAYKGCITIADEIKDGVKDAIASIKKCGIDNVVLLYLPYHPASVLHIQYQCQALLLHCQQPLFYHDR